MTRLTVTSMAYGFGGQDGSVIEHNTISMPTGAGGTAAVFIKTEFGPIDDVQVKNNLMTGDPSYTVYVEIHDEPHHQRHGRKQLR